MELLAENSISDFTIWIGPMPVRWVARHEDVNYDRGFVDVQETGPFKKWRHSHSYKAVNESRTQVIDEIEFAYSPTPFWFLFGHFIVWNLPLTFAYRSWITRKSLEMKPE